jgi:Ca-activated chloride channel homolog
MKKVRVLLLSITLLSLLVVACSRAESPQDNAGNMAREPVAEEAVVDQSVLQPKYEVAGQAEEALDSAYPTAAPREDRDEDYDEENDNTFADYGVNPMTDTDEDQWSTFAVDVDTGSFTIARRYLNENKMPYPSGVRVEEFINYFDQGYDRPSEREVFTINLDGGDAPFTESSRYQILRVGIQGYEVDVYERDDVSLTFVIDVSGSMDLENRLELVKDSLELLVDQLRPDDRVSIVVFGSGARVVLEPTDGDEKNEILNAIHRLKPEGATNAEAGLKLGYEMALRAFNHRGINRVILCSDGVANVGNTGAGSIWEEVEARASEGITLTTMGFGMGNYNDVLMEQLANMGNGFYAYVDDMDEAERLFVDNLVSTLQVIALDAKVQVEFNPNIVSRYRLIGFENRDIADEDFRNDDVDAGEIGAGHSVTALYEFKLFPGEQGEIATVSFRWQDPETYEVTEIREVFHTRELHEDFSDASFYFQWDVLVAEFAEVLRESYWARDTELDDMLDYFERLDRRYNLDEDREELLEMVETAEWLD